MISVMVFCSVISISVSSFLSVEAPIYIADGSDTLRYDFSQYLQKNRGNGIRQLSTCIASGVTIAGSDGFVEFSFGIPFYDYGTTYLPYTDFKVGAKGRSVSAYIGYTAPIVMREKEDRWGYAIYTEQISGSHSCYCGCVIERAMDRNGLYCDLSMRKEYNSYSGYKFGYYYDSRETYRIRETYWHSALTVSLAAFRKNHIQVLYVSFDQRHISEGVSVRLGLGIVLGTSQMVAKRYEVLTLRSHHTSVSPN
jgi:hypothetical protein